MTEDDASKWRKMLKMSTPHVGLYLFLFGYLLAGAYSFHLIEYDADRKIQDAKLERIKKDYQNFADALREMSPSVEKYDQSKEHIFQLLSEFVAFKLSSLHEGRPFALEPDLQATGVLPARWTQSSSFLYALSILTTTGYSYAVPVTAFGQFFAVGYGLLGIPMMVLAAVDIGRFMSHIVLTLYSKYREMNTKKILCGDHDVNSLTNTKTALVKKKSDGTRISEETGETEEEETENDETKKRENERLPLSINASILLVFCMLGGVTYIAAGGKATFIEAFFVTFNLVANLTMSEMPSDINHILTIIYIFVFVTFGVAVLSMCAELAAFELKELFMKIHYFGRKINFKRKQKKQMEVEVKELLKIIEEIRRRYPDKEHITSMDILQYMHETAAKPPSTERRDTIAFMPNTMDMLKFADELDLEDRSLSRVEAAAPIEKKTMVDVLQFAKDDDLEFKFYNELKKLSRCTWRKDSPVNV